MSATVAGEAGTSPWVSEMPAGDFLDPDKNGDDRREGEQEPFGRRQSSLHGREPFRSARRPSSMVGTTLSICSAPYRGALASGERSPSAGSAAGCPFRAAQCLRSPPLRAPLRGATPDPGCECSAIGRVRGFELRKADAQSAPESSPRHHSQRRAGGQQKARARRAVEVDHLGERIVAAHGDLPPNPHPECRNDLGQPAPSTLRSRPAGLSRRRPVQVWAGLSVSQLPGRMR